MNNKDTIVSKQLTAFIVATQIGFGILVLPSTLAEKCGHDGWIPLVLSGILITGATLIITSFMKRYEDKSILEINKFIYGKLLGNFLNSIIIIYTYGVAALALRVYVVVTRIFVLKNTPSLVLAVFLLAPAIYIVTSGFKVICRFSNLIFSIIFATCLIFALILPETRIINLMPIGKAGTQAILKAAGSTFTSFLGVELIAVVYDTVSDKENVTRRSVYAVVITLSFFLSVILVNTAFFGENALKGLVFPTLTLSRAVRVPIFERLDLFFIIIWLPAMGTTLISYFFCSYYGLKKMINLGNEKVFSTIFYIFPIFAGQYLKDFNKIQKALDISGIFGSIIIFLLCLSFLLSFIFKRGVKSYENKGKI